MADRALRFDLIGRDRSLGRTLKKGERDAERFRSRISGIGLAAGGAALGGLAILGAGALKLAGDFDDAYDTIRVGTGKTGKSLAGLKDDFRAVVKDIPTDFGTAATAIAELNKRTGQTGKGLQALAKREIELARITKTDLSTNIAATTRLFGDWGIKTEDQAATLDKLFRASQATGVGIDQLAQSVVKFGAPLRQLGFSFDQSIALLAKFEKEGVNSQLVMSGMRIALGKLAKAGKDPQQGFLDLVASIRDAGSTAAANKIALEAFGQRAGPDMAAAIREGRLSIADLQRQIASGKDTILGAAKDAEDFGEKWKRTTNKLKLLAEPIVSKGLDILSTKMGGLESFLTKNLNPRLGKLKKAWDDNKDSILALLDPFTSANEKSKTADQRAESLANSLTTVAEKTGQLARGLKRIEGHLNDLQASLDATAKALHVRFVRPAVASFAVLGSRMIATFHSMVRVAATAAEAMHLPWAKNLRRAEQDIGSFRAAFNREMNALRDENVNLKVKGTFTPPAGMSMRDIVFKHEGGPITTGLRSRDSALAMLRKGEHVWTPEEVDAAGGHGAMYRMRKAALAGKVRGFAAGGRVTLREDLPSATAMVAAGRRTVSDIGAMVARNVRATAQVLQALTGGSGAGFGSGSWMRAITELRRERVPYNIVSTFRPGARTHASGSVSFHALNRAVDLGGPSLLRIWRALTDTGPTELIYSGAPMYKSRRGWRPIGALDPITRADHWSHVHAAYDKGGWLPPGTSLATNRTGRPEMVLAAGQLEASFRKPLQSWVVPWLKRIALGVERGRLAGGVAGLAGVAKASAKTSAAFKRLTAQQLNRLPDAARWAYVGAHGRPTPPAGFAWAEDHSLVPTSFWNKTSFDLGGWLHPGTTVATNRTGRSEPVGFDYDRLAAAVAGPVAAAVAQALHGMTVDLDGQAVGALVVEPQFRDLRRLLRSSGRPSR